MGSRTEPLKGFSFKYGSKADTKGVLMWSDVFLHESGNEKFAIVLTDTQGLFEPKRPQAENARIFSLTNLISSIQIYNLKENIRENELEYLEMATEFTKLLASESHNPTVKTKLFQNMIFLVRDFNDEDIGFGFGGGNNLLEAALEMENTMNNEKGKETRENIRDAFESVKCFNMPFPGSAVRKKDFDGRWDKLEPDFIKELKTLIEYLLSPEKLQTKKILGEEVTGKSFHTYLFSYIFRNLQPEKSSRNKKYS